jgi:hypothetical protein
MSAVIKLNDVLEAMQLAGDLVEYFLDLRTGEVIMITDDIRFAMDNDEEDLNDCEDWIREPAQKYLEIRGTDNCLQLPGKFEIDEYSMMQSFIETIKDDHLCQSLLDAIHGKGAFRRFKDQIYRHGIEQSWFDFRDKAFRETAIQWLEDHNLPYSED